MTGVNTGGQLLIDSLLHNGVNFMTCVPGESFLPILDALYGVAESGDARAPQLITTRHEAAAANMAEAAGKLTGRPSVCFVTRGPGAMHASIAVHTAYQDGTPMLLVIGQVAQSVRGREGFQEMDYTAVFGTTAKHVVEIRSVDRVAEHITRALHIAVTGRPGPVVVVVPEDVLAETTDAQPLALPELGITTPSSTDVDALVAELTRAERPLLIVGGPKWSEETGRQVMGFAERSGIPVAAAFRWQDAVDNRSENYVGYLGLGNPRTLAARAQEADLIVAFGARLDDPTTDGFELVQEEGRSARIILIGDDAADAVTNFIPQRAIPCTPGSLAAALAEVTVPTRNPEWVTTLRAEFEQYRVTPSNDAAVDVAEIVKHVRAVLPDDAIVTNGAGNYTVWLQRFFEFRRYGTQLAPRNGAMGYGFPAALAAAAMHPERVVVAFAGDGCFLMSASELATAVKYQLKVIVIIVNNGMFGTIRMHQENHFPGRAIATDLYNPDFADFARSFGAHSSVIEATGDFAAAFERALEHSGPTVIEIRTDPELITPDRRLAV